MLKPARAKSWTVASCSEPLGSPSLSAISDVLEEAASLAGVTDEAVAMPAHFQQDRVIVAVGEHAKDFEPVTGRFALHPELLARTRIERCEASGARLR